MSDQALNNFGVTWNAGSTTFDLIKGNVTDTASAADSRLLELQVGGVSRFRVGKNGDVTSAGDFAGVDAAFSGNATIGGTFGATGAVTLSSTLAVVGAADFASPADFAAGSLAAPGITLGGDADTGLVYIGSGTWAFSSDGTQSLRFNSAGILGGGSQLTGLNATQLTTGTVPAARLPASGVTAASYGSASKVPALTIDSAGRITAAADVLIDGPSLTVSGLTMSTNGGANVTVQPGSAVASDGTVLRLTSAIMKQLSATFVAGTGNGGLDTGSEANSTWYHVHVIGNVTSGAVDVLLSTSFSSPTLPSGFTVSVPIGAVYNNSSGNLDLLSQQGDHFFWTTNPPPNDISVTNLASASGTLFALSVPSGVQVIAQVNGWFQDTTPSQVWLSSPDQPDNGTAASVGRTDASSAGQGFSKYVRTNASRQIRARGAAGTTGTLFLATLGWIYPRGGQ